MYRRDSLSCKMPAIRMTLLASLSVSAAAYAPLLQPRHRERPSIIAPRAAPVNAVHVDLSDPVTFGVFFLWGSPVPILFQALLKETEEAPGDEREKLAAFASASGQRFMGSEPYNMGYAFPSFQAQMEQPTEPSLLGPPGSPADRAVRWMFALNVYAGIGWYLW